MKQLSQRGNPEVIMTNDVPSPRQDQNILPSGLKLCSVITGGDHEKEEFLYYYGKQFSGRTLVFFNSIRKYVDEQLLIGVVKRVYDLLKNLNLTVYKIYSGMQQKQRIQHINAFTSHSDSLLLATDVAARGLDLPDLTTVIHYHLPPTPTIFVHRSGRTARAGARGISISLVSSQEKTLYQNICTHLHMTNGFPSFPLGVSLNPTLKQCVKLARQISDIVTKSTHEDRDAMWLKKNAIEAGLQENLEDTDDAVKLTNADKKWIRVGM